MIKRFAITGSAKDNPDSTKQYFDIFKHLFDMGLDKTSISDCDGLIFINYDKKSYKKYIKLGKNVNNLVLIRLEPIAVYPRQYSKFIERKFGLIIDPGRVITENGSSRFLGWPYKYHLNPAKPKETDPDLTFILNEKQYNNTFNYDTWVKKKDKIVMVAANRVSPTSKSNYKLRRRIAKRMRPTEIDIYGELWNSNLRARIYHRLAVATYSLKSGYVPNIIELYGSLFSRYGNIMGVINDKHSTIQKYRYSLVIENSSNYYSEKLFDAIINGSIPIYVGPKTSGVSFPENLFHWSDGSVSDIQNFINSLSHQKVSGMLKSMQDFIKSAEFYDIWASENVHRKICKHIYEFWDTK